MNTHSQVFLDVISKLIKKTDDTRQIVYLEGGYFDTRFGPRDFSTNTLQACIEVAEEIIKRKYKITRVMLGVLINNIGISCGEDVCLIDDQKKNNQDENDTEVPESLAVMLKKSKIAKEDQITTNERTLRNRGIRTIKNIVENKKSFSLETNPYSDNGILYSVVIDGVKIPLAIRKDNIWTARCPLIMGQHYSDLYIKSTKKYGTTTQQLCVDMCEMYDRHKVNNGAKVALLILKKLYGYDVSNLEIVNFSFNDDELTQSEYDVTGGSK